MKRYIYILPFVIFALAQPVVYSEEDHSDQHEENRNHHDSDFTHRHEEEHHDSETDYDHEHQEHEHHEELATQIRDNMASQVNISTASASPKVLHQTVIAYGSLTTAPEQLSHVRARYMGLIKSVKPTIGDTVKQGDLLAEVESNESLQTYKILAPISGTIVQRHANTGEVTQDQVLFSIANFDTLWAEFRIYPSQQSIIMAGQATYIYGDNQRISGSIEHLIPALDKPYQLARVAVDNRLKGLSPGMLVEGRIVVGEFKVNLAVEKNALQTMGNQQGIFLKNGEEYRFTPLQLGRSDERFTEVLGGLSPGQQYVTNNSYLIKADIEKSEAEHQH